jgi:hypothetical protein
MAEFDEIRDQLRQARANREKTSDSAFAAEERLRRLEARRAVLDRVFDPRNRAHVEERGRLARERAETERLLERRRGEQAEAKLSEKGLFASFAEWTDPQKAISQWNDQIPILLFPVRLETRFKTGIAAPTGRQIRQLWVRIYPDSCSIDSFEATLSETEVANAKLYWTGIWEAGGIEDQERGAWRGLVAAHGAGRAEWIISNYEPLNLAEKPVKAQPDDVILTIPTEAPLGDAESAAVRAFWIEVWKADGDREKEEIAFAALEAAVGAGLAAEVASRYPPANLAEKPVPPKTRDEVGVSAAFVVFPVTEDLDLKQHSWSRAPKVALMPDRFVFLGYAGSGPPLVVLGRPVPGTLLAGPDPSAPKEEQLRQDENGEIVIPEEMQWMVDFDRAIEVGMGFRIDLDPVQAVRGFDRVLVVGLRLAADETASQKDLETLIDRHRLSRTGFSLVPQGTPTNNTEAESSGHSRGSDADQSFDDLKKESLFDDDPDWLDKSDGQWLAEILGLDSAVLKKARHSGGKDQADARAMNTALWPATLGYWMETLMETVFTPDAVDDTREFFYRFVTGRGAIPAIRFGNQPYGILPATALSRMRWMERRDDSYLRRLYPILRAMDEDWKQMATEVAYAGKPGDPHQTLLDIVGLHSGSVEYWQRYAESALQFYNRLNLEGHFGFLTPLVIAGLQQAGTQLLAKLGHDGAPPDLLEKFFYGKQNLMKGPVVDDRPLSETETIRPYAADGERNYIEWLVDAARTSLQALYAQDGFAEDKTPRALLYLLLRHALQLGYHDVSVRLHESAGLLSAEGVRAARRDDPFLHVRAQAPVSESRYQLLTRAEPAITQSATMTVGEFIGSSLQSLPLDFYLPQQLRALEKLKDASTARLERALAEHIDCCTYRLDAWLQGLVHVQLAQMRNLRDGGDAPPRQGIHLGAYAWLEEVRPENKVFTPVDLPEDLAEDFDRPGEPPLQRDSTNQGYIHAPSLNHAVAAAVLRNGYIANASSENRETLAVNLTSERVRTALAILEGIRGGQSLSALLGYQLERGLHDRYALAHVDGFIFDLRKAFPLRGNRLASTRAPEGEPIEKIEARNVIDGLALVNQIKSTGNKTYPFGKELPDADAGQKSAINAEADRLLETHDAVADLALAEGVYQAVLGNYDRVAATYDTYSKGNFPPEPQVVQTPTNGTGLTHRVGLHLEAGADPAVSPWTGVPMTPRARAEPAVNDWLAAVLPPPEEIACTVSFVRAADNAPDEQQVTIRDLLIQPADLLRLTPDDSKQERAELDDRIVRFTILTHAPRPDGPIEIHYMKKTTAPFSVFEVMPLLRHLRRLAQTSRPLRPTDLTLSDEGAVGQDAAVFVDKTRLDLVEGAMGDLRADLAGFEAALAPLLADLPNRRADVITGIDATVTDLVSLLARAAGFAIPQTGWGFAYDFEGRVLRAVFTTLAERAARWTGRLNEFEALMVEYGTLAADEEKFALLVRAEGLLATAPTSPLPALPDDFKNDLETIRRPAFVNKLAAITAVRDTPQTSVAQLLANAGALLPVTAFDPVALSFAEPENEAVRFAEDAVSVAKVVLAEIDRRRAAAQARFDEHDATAQDPERVKALEAAAKALLGDDFVVVPEFSLGAAQGDEMEKALTASQSRALFDHLENTLKMDFPEDTWLYGVARVREKMRAWEQVVMLAGAFDVPEPTLTPLQLPFLADDSWLALEFPKTARLDTDRLLYTAAFHAPFNKAGRQCGLLVDEWTEVIPSEDATTGLAFHYDRPSSEPPQTMLLVTPAAFTGSWTWEDLVDALNETLDFAKRRAVEPVHVDKTAYARFLPATTTAVTMNQLTISLQYALNNTLLQALGEE